MVIVAMSPLEEQIVGGCIVGLFVAALRLMDRAYHRIDKRLEELNGKVSKLAGEVGTMKEFWIRTAERRDHLLHNAERWKNVALHLQGVSSDLLDPPEPGEPS